MLPDIQPGNTKILYFFNCLLDGMHTIYLQDFCLSAAQEISWRDLGKKAEDTEISRKLNSIGLIHKLLS